MDSVAGKRWLNQHAPAPSRALRQAQDSACIEEEAGPFLRRCSSAATIILPAGASLGAYRAANSFFRRPDFFGGMVGMSGSYDITLSIVRRTFFRASWIP